MVTDSNSEDRLVQETFAVHLAALGWESVYAWNSETFGPDGTLGRADTTEVILVAHLRAALARLNPEAPAGALDDAVRQFTAAQFSRSAVEHNRELHRLIREGAPVSWIDAAGQRHDVRLRVLDFREPTANRFVAVRELKIRGQRVPHYDRRADLVCYVNGLPLVFVELKAVHKDLRRGFDDNLADYKDTIPHAFHANAFLVVSNGAEARYGSLTAPWEHFYEWKRNAERDKPCRTARALVEGMLAKDRLLDLVENFVLFDDSRQGMPRKIVARNHQVLGVNAAVAAVRRQEELKLRFPPGERLRHSWIRGATTMEETPAPDGQTRVDAPYPQGGEPPAREPLPLVERAHPDLGRLGVFWHTQGSGKSYSMAMFVEKVRRTVPGNFTFLVLTDRDDLDDQIHRTFVGCGLADKRTPRAASGKALRERLRENHALVFTLIHKFNQPVSQRSPYSERDDIIVLSDEAHRTQAGKFARNLRLALPNAAFIGFTGTPLFKYDHLTRRIFGGYISRYDFRRAEEDGATVRLVYENRGEKLGVTTLDLNDRLAEAVEAAGLDADQVARLERLLGKDYEVITADDRLAKIARDFVEHCSARWEAGKAMLVCIDKVTCARMLALIRPLWAAKTAAVQAEAEAIAARAAALPEGEEKIEVARRASVVAARAAWMVETAIHFVVSESQGEVAEFAKWGCDIAPHRDLIKHGFPSTHGRPVPVEDAFKDPAHPFRIAIVCAMWLTGFDVECLSTLYLDKPMKAHTLMQAIARANRVWPGKDCGVIVDYNGMLASLRKALAAYATDADDDASPKQGIEEGGNGDAGESPVSPIAEQVKALVQAIEAAEAHLAGCGFAVARLAGAKGFDKIEAIADACDAVRTSDESQRRFEVMARTVFSRFKALVPEPAADAFAARRDDIETIYRRLTEKRDQADITSVLKQLHRIVNNAVRTAAPGDDHRDAIAIDLSRLDFEKLREEFATKARRKANVLHDIRQIVEHALLRMMAANPLTMDYYRRYQEIVADYNREKDRATIEKTFGLLVTLAGELDAEQRRAAEEGLSERELALFALLGKPRLAKTERERLKQASRELYAALVALVQPMPAWTENETTQSRVRVEIRDRLFIALPDPDYSEMERSAFAERVFNYVFGQSVAGTFASDATAA